jgi:hypothetical protein
MLLLNKFVKPCVLQLLYLIVQFFVPLSVYPRLTQSFDDHLIVPVKTGDLFQGCQLVDQLFDCVLQIFNYLFQ